MKINTGARKFKTELEGAVNTPPPAKSTAVLLEDMQKTIVAAVETKLEEKKEDIKAAIETKLEASFDEKLNAHKQEVVELSRNNAVSVVEANKIEGVQLSRLNSCQREGGTEITLEQLREYYTELNRQVRGIIGGENIKLDAILAGFAGYDDAKGGALIVPEYDPTIRQDWQEYDEGLFNTINFEPAMSRSKKVVVDLVEPDENTKALRETLEKIGYELDDGCFVSANLNLRNYETPARLTFDMIEDTAFRIENYVNGKCVQGNRRKVAKDLWVGDNSQRIKGIFNYPRGNGYGEVGEKHVEKSGKVTMADIIAFCIANRSRGVLFVDRTTWSTAISEKDANGRYVFEQGSTVEKNGGQPFHVDAMVPLVGVPVVFDDAFGLPEAVAKNIKAAILPSSAVAGFKRPVARLGIKDDLRARDILVTERYDAVLTQFKLVKLLIGTAA